MDFDILHSTVSDNLFRCDRLWSIRFLSRHWTTEANIPELHGMLWIVLNVNAFRLNEFIPCGIREKFLCESIASSAKSNVSFLFPLFPSHPLHRWIIGCNKCASFVGRILFARVTLNTRLLFLVLVLITAEAATFKPKRMTRSCKMK